MLTRRSLLLGAGASAVAGCTLAGAEPDPPLTGPAYNQPPEAEKPPPPKPAAGPERTTLVDRVEGRERRAVLVVPRSYDPDTPVPLLIGAHGANRGPEQMLDHAGWGAECEERGWIGVFPELGEASRGGIDDVYLLALIARLTGDYAIEDGRVLAAAFSGGCRKIYGLAAQHSDKVRAVAGASGILAYEGETTHHPAAHDAGPVSLAHIHGGKDAKVPVDGTAREARDGKTRVIEPLRPALKRWTDHHGLERDDSDWRPKGLPDRVPLERWKRSSGLEIWLMIDPELGHRWPDPWGTRVLADFLAAAPASS